MSANSKIEWCDHTQNFWEGCQKAGPGCDLCYAEARNKRFGGGVAANWGPGAPRRRTSEPNWRKPLAWNANHAAFFAEHGRRQRVFCSSLADVFDNAVDPQWRDDMWQVIWDTPNLDWLLLTKRIGNALAMLPEEWGNGLIDHWPNVWIGATIVNQEEANRDIPKLLAVPAAKRFLSMEPLLGPVDLTELVETFGPGNEHVYSALECDVDPEDDEWHGAKLDWVIVGGESGAGARPMHPDWARSLRDQCEAARVPFLFKQWGEFHPSDSHDYVELGCVRTPEILHADGRREYRPLEGAALIGKPGWAGMCHVGKKAAGRLLDGRTWDGFPS